MHRGVFGGRQPENTWSNSVFEPWSLSPASLTGLRGGRVQYAHEILLTPRYSSSQKQRPVPHIADELSLPCVVRTRLHHAREASRDTLADNI